MAGMFRLKDEKALEDLLARSSLRVARGIKEGKPFQGKPLPAAPATPPATRDGLPRAAEGASDIEDMLAAQIAEAGLPQPLREYHHLRGKGNRLDFAWPEYTYSGLRIGVEVQGMVHRTKGRFSTDMKKRATSLLQGWAVLEVGGEHVRNRLAIAWLVELFDKAVKGKT